MKAFAVIALFAIAASAAPEIKARGQYPTPGDIPVDEAHQMCGTDLSLHCCNKVDESTKVNAQPNFLGSLIGSILGSNGFLTFDQCSPISVSGNPGGGDILNSHCKAKPACCQQSPSMATGGLVNLALPCLAISSLVG